MSMNPAAVPASALAGASWFKSSYSNGGGNCVEVATGFPGIVPIRDSKVPHGPALAFDSSAWTSFITAIQDAEFDV